MTNPSGGLWERDLAHHRAWLLDKQKHDDLPGDLACFGVVHERADATPLQHAALATPGILFALIVEGAASTIGLILDAHNAVPGEPIGLGYTTLCLLAGAAICVAGAIALRAAGRGGQLGIGFENQFLTSMHTLTVRAQNGIAADTRSELSHGGELLVAASALRLDIERLIEQAAGLEQAHHLQWFRDGETSPEQHVRDLLADYRLLRDRIRDAVIVLIAARSVSKGRNWHAADECRRPRSGSCLDCVAYDQAVHDAEQALRQASRSSTKVAATA